MDYELIYVFAIFLLVKIAALSPEFPASEEKKKPGQIRDPEAPLPLAASLAEEERPGSARNGPYRGKHFGWGPGDGMRADNARRNAEGWKEIKENQSFDTCEHKIELLESSPKWRNIQKTLRWLDRILSSNDSMERCGKIQQRRMSRNHEFRRSKWKKFKSFFKRKKPKKEKLTSNIKSSVRSSHEKKVKRKRTHDHKSWRTGREKLTKHWKRHGNGKNELADSSPLLMNATAIKKLNNAFLKKGKTRKGCLSSGPGGCGKDPDGATQAFERVPPHPNEAWTGGRKTPNQKANAWPHFVYHRVSSNFLHPEPAGHGHRQSAYVAISVATSSKPENTDNNVG